MRPSRFRTPPTISRLLSMYRWPLWQNIPLRRDVLRTHQFALARVNLKYSQYYTVGGVSGVVGCVGAVFGCFAMLLKAG
jgi:hypothetical protein